MRKILWIETEKKNMNGKRKIERKRKEREWKIYVWKEIESKRERENDINNKKKKENVLQRNIEIPNKEIERSLWRDIKL